MMGLMAGVAFRLALGVMTLISLGHGQLAEAQEEILPKGIGLYQFGYRPYLDITHKYDASGASVPLGEPFNKTFDGPGLLQGAGGSDLQRLADHLQRFDSFANTNDGLLQSLNLGQMSGEVKANIEARIFALAYGVGEHLTLFTGIPWVTASVEADVIFVPSPNAQGAQAIKARLGDAAFDQLKSGLDRASQLSSALIKQSITDKGYAPIERWENSGLGDIRFGSILGRDYLLARRVRGLQSWRSTVIMPTGYQDDPDILTDVAISQGYYSWSNELSQRIVWRSGFWLGVNGGYGLNLPATVQRRVPVGDEGMVDADRRADVQLTPGSDITGMGSVGFAPGAIRFSYELGVAAHMADSYSGSLAGNYDKLAQDSDSQSVFQIAGMQIHTADLYRRKRFPVPFILDVKYQMALRGTNAPNERFFEISLTSFFKTPAAAAPRSAKKLQAH